MHDVRLHALYGRTCGRTRYTDRTGLFIYCSWRFLQLFPIFLKVLEGELNVSLAGESEKC